MLVLTYILNSWVFIFYEFLPRNFQIKKYTNKLTAFRVFFRMEWCSIASKYIITKFIPSNVRTSFNSHTEFVLILFFIIEMHIKLFLNHLPNFIVLFNRNVFCKTILPIDKTEELYLFLYLNVYSYLFVADHDV